MGYLKKNSLTAPLSFAIKVLSLVFLVNACVKEEILEKPDSPDKIVRVIFSSNGLGDLSYNDDILRGILQEKGKNNFRLQYLSPANVNEAEIVFRHWQEEDTDRKRYFTILASSEYEDVACRMQPQTVRDNYLMFDTTERGLTIPAFRFCGYGVSFLAGLAAYAFTKSDTVAYMGGQQGEYFIEECYEGFRMGYLYAGGEAVVATYLSEESIGFAMPSRAYLMADSLFKLYPFIYVMAGGSNNGVYQFLREHPRVNGYTAGVDVDQSAYSERIIGSMIKNIGKCVGNYLHMWMEEQQIPHYSEYDLRSGYIYFQVSEAYEDKLGKIVEENYELAIRKEDEYGKEKE